MNSDAPIQNSASDLLGTDAFAERLLGPLLGPLLEWPSDDSIVLGLYGPCGSGKSSLQILLTARIRERAPDVAQGIVMRFNSWIYSDPETIVAAFFAELSQTLRAKRDATKDELEALGAWTNEKCPQV